MLEILVIIVSLAVRLPLLHDENIFAVYVGSSSSSSSFHYSAHNTTTSDRMKWSALFVRPEESWEKFFEKKRQLSSRAKHERRRGTYSGDVWENEWIAWVRVWRWLAQSSIQWSRVLARMGRKCLATEPTTTSRGSHILLFIKSFAIASNVSF